MKRLIAEFCSNMNLNFCVPSSGMFYMFLKFRNMCVPHLNQSLFSTYNKKSN